MLVIREGYGGMVCVYYFPVALLFISFYFPIVQMLPQISIFLTAQSFKAAFNPAWEGIEVHLSINSYINAPQLMLTCAVNECMISNTTANEKPQIRSMVLAKEGTMRMSADTTAQQSPEDLGNYHRDKPVITARSPAQGQVKQGQGTCLISVI